MKVQIGIHFDEIPQAKEFATWVERDTSMRLITHFDKHVLIDAESECIDDLIKRISSSYVINNAIEIHI